MNIELDDGHVYGVPVAPPAGGSIWDAVGAAQQPVRQPNTGDVVKLCQLTATDGSRHYSLELYPRTYQVSLVR
jgi:hypothetical protein